MFESARATSFLKVEPRIANFFSHVTTTKKAKASDVEHETYPRLSTEYVSLKAVAVDQL